MTTVIITYQSDRGELVNAVKKEDGRFIVHILKNGEVVEKREGKSGLGMLVFERRWMELSILEFP